MKIYFLGTNGWFDTETGNTVCTLIETKNEYTILDAGNGLYKIDRFIKTKKPIYLFLSHYHLDHTIGLHTLAKFNFPQGIKVFGPPGLKKLFKTIISRPYSAPLKMIKTKVTLQELNPKTHLPLKVKFLPLRHPVLCYGYRFQLEEKIVAYCTDTGYCPNLLKLAENADLLILECSFKSGQHVKEWPHLNPEEAATVAKKAGVKKLVLIHFDAELYKTLAERKKAEKIAQKIFKMTRAATDGLKNEI